MRYAHDVVREFHNFNDETTLRSMIVSVTDRLDIAIAQMASKGYRSVILGNKQDVDFNTDNIYKSKFGKALFSTIVTSGYKIEIHHDDYWIISW